MKKPATGLVYMREMTIFLYFIFLMRKMCGFILCFGTKLCSWSRFIVSEKKQQIHHNLTSFFFFFLNVCNTVMMTFCHVEMSAVLFLYVCVQASKEIIKLNPGVYACSFFHVFGEKRGAHEQKQISQFV